MSLVFAKKKSGPLSLKRIIIFLALMMAAGFCMPVVGLTFEPVGEFEDLALFVVYNVSDEDAQIIARGGSEDGIRKVVIFGPRGKVCHNAYSKDKGWIGQADFQFDTPEPLLEDLMEAYPPGVYCFRGKTVDGDILANTVELSYDLLDPPTIIYPQEGATDIPTDGLVVLFEAPEGTEAILLELEDEEEEVALKVDLLADTSSFEVPNNWLKPGIEYVLDIKIIAENGNQTVRDIRFMTAE